MTALLPPNMCQTKLFDGTLMNLRFDPSGVAGEKGLEIIESVIREYVQHDGQHIQINVVDDKTLRAAKKIRKITGIFWCGWPDTWRISQSLTSLCRMPSLPEPRIWLRNGKLKNEKGWCAA